MLLLSIITFSIAFLSASVSLATDEDVVQASMACVAILAGLLTLIIAPWGFKLIIVAFPFILENFRNWSSDQLYK